MTPVFLSLDHVLRMHRSLIDADEDALVDITLRVATGKAGKPEIAAFFRSVAHSD